MSALPDGLLRALLKGAAERAMVWSGGARLARRRMTGRALVLAYHNVVPDDAPPMGDRANHLPLASFRAQMRELRSTHDVVPLAELLTLAPRRATRPRAAITFDDAYRGTITLAIPELVRLGLPATVFVAPAMLGGKTFWWDALGSAGDGLDAGVRGRALHELCGQEESVRRWARDAGLDLARMPDMACTASEDEVVAVAALPGISLGSHSWSHPNLTRISQSELSSELARPLAWLTSRVAKPLPWIAYPYGCFDGEVERAAAAAGYSAALGVSGGWLSSRTTADLFALPRENIPPGLSIHGFVMRGAGLLNA